MSRLLLILCTAIVFVSAAVLYEGEECINGEKNGICRRFSDCQAAQNALYSGNEKPKICSWLGNEQVVCCSGADAIGNRRQRTTSTTTEGLRVPPIQQRTTSTTTEGLRVPPIQQRTTSTTTEGLRVPPIQQRTTSTTTEGLRVATLKPSTTTEYEPEIPDSNEENDTCPELSPDVTAPKTGSKAWDKCIEYQDSFVYPCRRMLGSQSRAKLCHHVTDTLILGGEDAKENEFPHMVLLGYKPPGVNKASEIKWKCAGTILSSSYVLTAGHCTSNREFKKVRLVRTGVLDRSSPYKDHQVYWVDKIIKHPDFKPPSRYHDIALLKTRNPMKLDSYVTPACLDLGRGVDNNMALVTGWGQTSEGGKDADRLQKVILAKFPPDECQNWYGRDRNMAQGYLDDRQICYGDQQQLNDLRNTSIPPADRIARVYDDSCKGDSGGPAQVKNSVLKCMYTVVGVNSFGKGCGNGPGVYTRVSYYVPWIESVVWG